MSILSPAVAAQAGFALLFWETAMKLRVARIRQEDVYKDIARIPEAHRFDRRGKRIPEARICKVTTGGRSVLLSLRGQQEHGEPAIQIDDKTRQALGIEEGREAEFAFRKVGWPGQFLWAWRAADPAYRIAARLGLLSVILGLAGLAIAVMTLSCW
jgi:hypothetical protein